ncbi:MAG: DivIVA domain-containing protein [Clostridia bacterium]|nr:DivIVA domain-containing protein [Clostridia bacterium]
MLTPVDIENKDFKKVMRGYDVYEVESFIKDIVADYEKLYRENANMKEKIEMLTSSLTNYRAMEETMQNAMIVAQSTAEDIKKNAFEKANNIVNEAELKAKETVKAAEKEIAELSNKYQNLKSEIDSFKNRIKGLIVTYDKLLDDFPKSETGKVSEIKAEETKAEAKEEIKEEIAQEIEAAKEEPIVLEQEKEVKPQRDIYEELKKVSKRENREEEIKPQNPRLDKQNALLDEILTNREKPVKTKAEERANPFKAQNAESGAVREVVINLSRDEEKKGGSYYDVFKDDSL